MPQKNSHAPMQEEAFSSSLFPVGENGSLHAVQTPRFKTSRLSLFTVLPLTQKTAVLAPLMLSVLRRGCQGYPTLADINRRLDDLWGASIRFRDFPFGDRKILGVTLEYIDPCYLPGQISLLPDLLDLLRRILFCPVTDQFGLFPADVVEREKELQCDEIKSLVANPPQYAAEHAQSFFFEGRPCGIPPYGSVEQTQKVTPAELTGYWQTWRETSFFSFFSVGASDPQTVADALVAVFGNARAAKIAAPASFLDVPPPAFAAAVRKKEEALPIAQGHLLLGFQTGGVVWGDARAQELQVAKELLGGSPTSLLFMNVREKLSLCYSVSSVYLASRAALFVQCALRSSNREIAEREILRQVERLQAGDFSDAELEGAKKSLIFYARTIADTPGSMEFLLLRQMLTGVAETPAGNIAALQKMDRGRVVAAAKLLTPETIYFLRPTAKEEEQDEI